MTEVEFANLHLQLAAQACENSIKSLNQNFPVNWNLIATAEISADVYGTPMPVQYLLARSPQDPAAPGAVRNLVLAIGINWAKFLGTYIDLNPKRVAIDPTLIENQPAAEIHPDFQTTYTSYFRAQIWDLLYENLAPKDSLSICGMGLGAVMAQLATLDLRNGHIAAGLKRPTQLNYTPKCFVFSPPNLANSALQSAYNTAITDPDTKEILCLNYQINNPRQNLFIDHFPLMPNQETDYYPLGDLRSTEEVKLPAPPKVGGPWLERGNAYYQDALEGMYVDGPRIENQDIQRPEGYNKLLAHQYAQLVSNTYHSAQHPGTGFELPDGYLNVAGGVVEINGSIWARLFKNTASNTFILAIRGTTTWQEFQSITANSQQATSDLISGGWSPTGLQNFYFAKGRFEGSSALGKSIIDMLKAQSVNELSLCGHDIGASFASMMVMDLLNQNSAIKVNQVYCYGALPIGDQLFAEAFATAVKIPIYNIRRLYDTISTYMIIYAGYKAVGEAIIFEGQLAQEENTYHAINGYFQLLNPY